MFTVEQVYTTMEKIKRPFLLVITVCSREHLIKQIQNLVQDKTLKIR